MGQDYAPSELSQGCASPHHGVPHKKDNARSAKLQSLLRGNVNILVLSLSPGLLLPSKDVLASGTRTNLLT